MGSIDEVAAAWFLYRSGGDAGAVLFLIIPAVIFVIWLLSRPPKTAKKRIPVPPDGRFTNPDSGINLEGGAYGDTFVNRRRENITEVAPSTVVGRIREIRHWRDKGRLFTRKMTGFHLDCDRSQMDFGDLQVRLRDDYFPTLNLRDGDLLEIGLKWKRRQKYGCISFIRNRESGQRSVPSSVSEKVGTLEESVLLKGGAFK
jgi:hypothetical protein